MRAQTYFIPLYYIRANPSHNLTRKRSPYHLCVAQEISEKIKKYAYSGGGETLAEHKANGANLEVDVSYNWLRFFLEDDEELARIGEEYGSGRMMTGEVKEILITLLQGIVKKHQEGRSAVSDDLVKEFMSVRRLNFRRPGDQ